jgi:hypothetical protein
MPSAASVRLDVEATLSKRVPAALTPKIRQAPEMFSTGLPEADLLLGGVPRGGITQVIGAASTGKTSFTLSTLRTITQSGAVCAWVDTFDTLSPESAAGAGVILRRMLWLRLYAKHKDTYARLEQSLKATDLLLQTGGFAAIVLDMSDAPAQFVSRIPLTTWYRFRLATEHARTALVVLAQAPCVNSCASLSVRCEAPEIPAFSERGETPLFEHLQYQLIKERNRNETSFQKKPAGRVTWAAAAQWVK